MEPKHIKAKSGRKPDLRPRFLPSKRIRASFRSKSIYVGKPKLIYKMKRLKIAKPKRPKRIRALKNPRPHFPKPPRRTKSYLPRLVRPIKIRINGYQLRTIQNLGSFSEVDSSFSRSVSRSRSGSANPYRVEQIKTGINATTNLYATDEIYVVKEGHYNAFFNHNLYGVNHHLVTGLFPGISLPSPSSMIGPDLPLNMDDVVDEANAKAIKALYKKINEVRHQFNGGLFLAELNKTVSSIKKPAQALRKLANQQHVFATSYLNKNKRKLSTPAGRKEVQKAIAGSYLEATFAWQPLLADVKDGAKALARLQREIRHERFRAFGTAEQITSSDSYLHFGYDLPRSDIALKRKQVATVVYYGAYQGISPNRLADDSATRIVELSGFDLGSFIPTVWEVIPYSFLIDYFVNIGDMLEAASTDTSIVKRVSKVVIKEWVYELTFKPNFAETASEITSRYGAVTDLQQAGLPGKVVLKKRDVLRTPLTSVPFLMPRFEVPNIFSRHSLNIAALVAGARPPRLT